MKTQKKSQTDQMYRVGSEVSFVFGRERVKGIIVEDRGAIGVGGRHLYRIEAPLDQEEPLVTELPAEHLQPA